MMALSYLIDLSDTWSKPAVVFKRRYPITLTPSGVALARLCVMSVPLVSLIDRPELLFFIAALWGLGATLYLEGHQARERLVQLELKWERTQERLYVTRGELLRVHLLIHNPHPSPLHQLKLYIRSQDGRSDPLIIQLPALGALRVPVDLEGRALGEERLWGVELQWGGPLNAHKLHVHHARSLSYTVQPRLPKGGPRYQRALGSPAEGVERQLRTHEGDFQELRSYHVGDELRRVAWRASARRGELLTKVYEQPLRRRALIAIDIGPAMRVYRAGQGSALTHAIELAYAELKRSRDLEVGLALFDHRLIASLPPRARALSSYLQLLQYAAQVYETDCTDLDHQHLTALLGEQLYWLGVESVRLGGLDQAPARAQQRLLKDEYWSEAIKERVQSALEASSEALFGLSDPQWRSPELSACEALGLRVPYRQSSRYGASAQGLRELSELARRWGATELLILSDPERLEAQSDLYPLRSWAERGGQLTWCEVSTVPSDRPTAPELPLLCEPRALLMSLRGCATLLRAQVPPQPAQLPLNIAPVRFAHEEA